jgi:hypothetical protein
MGAATSQPPQPPPQVQVSPGIVIPTLNINTEITSWNKEKKSIIQAKQVVDSYTTEEKINQYMDKLNYFISNFVKRGGITNRWKKSDGTIGFPPRDDDYINANTVYQGLESFQDLYIVLNRLLINGIKKLSDVSDIENKLKMIGALQQSINKLEKELKDVKQDADTSITRQSSIEHPREDLSWYQGFSGKIGFTKPLKQTSVAFMIGFGFLLIFMCGLILREFYNPVTGVVSEEDGLFSVFTDSRYISVLGGSAFIMVILVILSIKGYLGKNVP